jgi:hypothetical protein
VLVWAEWIRDRHFLLPLDVKATVEQLELQTSLIRGFQQPRPQLAMHGNGSANDRLSEVVQFLFLGHGCLSFLLCVFLCALRALRG